MFAIGRHYNLVIFNFLYAVAVADPVNCLKKGNGICSVTKN